MSFYGNWMKKIWIFIALKIVTSKMDTKVSWIIEVVSFRQEYVKVDIEMGENKVVLPQW